MVYIKRIEINGFKSFGKHVILNLDKGLICITGPNGSGKSNVLDAIAFALGENSGRVLRVDRLHSLIHDNGNSKAKRLRVSITLDNSDRGIPVDADTVTIAREMGIDSNESDYYLNGKHINRSVLTDMLEASLVSAGRLNIVQQGMVMRIAELNREERRRIIEDILGLSYFDEKKEEARKQLDEADRRLEVALARIGEVRKRIDELEQERNDQLRFEFLEHEIARLRRIKLTNTLNSLRERISMLKDKIREREQEADKVSKELEVIRDKVNAIESERFAFMREMDSISKTKAEISKRISSIIIKVEQLRAMLATNKGRIVMLGERIAKVMKEREVLRKKVTVIDKDIAELGERLKVLEEKKRGIDDELAKVNSMLDELNSRYNAVKVGIDRINEKVAVSKDKYSTIELQIVSSRERLKILDNSLHDLERRRDEISNNIDSLRELIAKLEDARGKIVQELESIRSEHEKLSKRKSILDRQVSDALLLFNKAREITTKYKAIIETATHGEDNAIAYLLSSAEQFNIVGLVHNLISWDKGYERAVLAAASNWLNAIVVKDIRSMLSILEHVRIKRLPRITIIPLDILASLSYSSNSKAMKVADVIECKYKGLKEFIFNDTLLAKDVKEAIELAEDGYRVVTVSGELFEPELHALVVDLTSRMSNIFKLLLKGKSLQDLDNVLEMLRQIIDRKSNNAKEMNNLLSSLDSKISMLEQELVKLDLKYEHSANMLRKNEESLEGIDKRMEELKNEKNILNDSIESLLLKRLEVEKEIDVLMDELRALNTQSESLLNSVSEIERKKSNLMSNLYTIEREIRDVLTQISSKNAQREGIIKRIDDMTREVKQTKQETLESARIVRECSERLIPLEDELKAARIKEQEVIYTSTGYLDRLNAYDSELKRLREEERALSKQLSILEKDIALSSKELSDLTTNEQKIKDELALLPNTMSYDEHDNINNVSEALLDELMKEMNELKKHVNQLANKSYMQLIEGYRGLSEKKNQLEEERNAIVRFIEQIESEKMQLFLNAYTSIDREVRSIFSTMTDGKGSAWLEIEKPDDIFSSGIIFMIQFPNKPPRESNSLSGGEKTIAAITFLLALQSLKPAPFYLFDEIDAHLDSINTERLRRIVKDRARISQILMVTLKDALVASADMVYGVYAKDGISHVVRYKIPINITP